MKPRLSTDFNGENDLPVIRGTYRRKVLLANTTWFKVGGEAEVLFKPKDLEDLCFFLKNKPQYVPSVTLGLCSNILVRDNGIAGVVVKLGQNFNKMYIQNQSQLVVGAGCLNYNVSHFAYDNSLTGLEFLVGIPGSIGGALMMNAGAYEQDIASILYSAELVDDLGNIHHLTNREIGYFYRGNSIPKSWTFTQATLSLANTNSKIIQSKMNEIMHNRAMSQPIRSKTGGSTFKNPPRFKAWRLIDAAGCRGLSINDAQISNMHCNFLINTNKATAKDLEDLGLLVVDKVFHKTGIKLEWEIQRLGLA